MATSFVFAQSSVDQLDDINRELEQIREDLLKDVGSDTPKDTNPSRDIEDVRS